MPQLNKSITMNFFDEEKITKYCKENDVSFSKFVTESALNRIEQKRGKL